MPSGKDINASANFIKVAYIQADIYKAESVYLPNPTAMGRVWHKVNFQAKYNNGIQNFPSPWVVAQWRLKFTVCLTIYP